MSHDIKHVCLKSVMSLLSSAGASSPSVATFPPTMPYILHIVENLSSRFSNSLNSFLHFLVLYHVLVQMHTQRSLQDPVDSSFVSTLNCLQTGNSLVEIATKFDVTEARFPDR